MPLSFRKSLRIRKNVWIPTGQVQQCNKTQCCLQCICIAVLMYIFNVFDVLLLMCSGKGNLPDELDEIEVYGSEAQSGTQLATYSFEVRPFFNLISVTCWYKLSQSLFFSACHLKKKNETGSWLKMSLLKCLKMQFLFILFFYTFLYF